VADELQELKERLADLSTAVDELLARQKAQQPADQPAQPPGDQSAQPPSTPEP
jgi:hypothetical protein